MPRQPVADLGVGGEQQDLARSRLVAELEGQDKAAIVGVAVELERQVAGGAGPVVIDAAVLLREIMDEEGSQRILSLRGRMRIPFDRREALRDLFGQSLMTLAERRRGRGRACTTSCS